MKKIGILTFHRAKNYGAQVQAYALLSYIRKCFPGVEVEIIDYRSVAESKYYFKSVIRNGIKVSIKAAMDEIRRNCWFNRFAESLPLSSERVVSDDADKLFKKIRKKYDVIVVGSDAIFSWKNRKFPIPFFLGDQLGCVKVSYAASAHGLDYLDADKEKIDYCNWAFSDFDYIGARDAHTEKFIKHCAPQMEVHHNCDPSLLLDMSILNYTEIRNKLIKANVDLKKPVILVMTADPKIVKPVFERYSDQCEFVSVYLHNPLIKKFVANLSPLEWAGVFRYAAFTVTEYFHGTLLSLKNLTPVISVDRTDVSKGYEGKIRDVLLNRLKLDEMYYEFKVVDTEEYDQRVLAFSKQALSGVYKEQIEDALKKETENIDSFIQFLKGMVHSEQ